MEKIGKTGKNVDCYFFGTFNPPHLGHINLAKKVKEEFGFKKIVFVPAYAPPHKETLEFAHRYNMLKLCVSKDLGEVSNIESTLNVPSYTYRTINKLYKGQKIPFIIGYDAFIGLENWKNPEILKEKLKFIVLKRHSGVSEEEILEMKSKGYDFEISKTAEYFDVSSNQTRTFAKMGQSLENLVSTEVEGYINEHKLYC